jgi:hypothetical protein
VGRMRWKKNKLDAILNAVADKVGRDMTVVAVTKKKTIFIKRLKTKTCPSIKNGASIVDHESCSSSLWHWY